MIVRKENIHCRELSECVVMISEIKNKALQYSQAFSEIIVEYNNKDKFKNFDFIGRFAEYINSGLNAPDAWRSSLEQSDCSLYQWERDVVIRFGENLCYCPKSDIDEYGTAAISDLKQFNENAKEKKNKSAKTGAVFTVSAGVMIALLIL